MSPARKRILRRALKALVATLLSGAVAAVGSPSFREFLGDSDLGLIAYAVLPSLVLAAEKAFRERS